MCAGAPADALPEHPWRFIDDGAGDPCWNMAVDEALLACPSAEDARPVLRVYSWSQPAVSLGRSQDAAACLDLDYCSCHGIAIVRRPTGGNAVLHGADATYSIVGFRSALGLVGRSPRRLYQSLLSAPLRALRALGVECEAGNTVYSRVAAPDCFSHATCADLVRADGRKVLGSALRVQGSRFLQQCSLPLGPCDAALLGVYRQPIAARSCALGGISAGEFASALRRAVEAEFGATMVDSGLYGAEQSLARELRPRVATTSAALRSTRALQERPSG